MGIIGDFFIVIFILLLLVPSTRKETIAMIIRTTLLIHQPSVNSEPVSIEQETFQWNLNGVNTNDIDLDSFKGKTYFVNIWATWCPPCIAEMPNIQSLYNEFGSDVEFLLISYENKETLSKYISSKAYSFPVFSATNTPAFLETTTVPTTFIISNNKIYLHKKGAAKWNSKKVKELLNDLIN